MADFSAWGALAQNRAPTEEELLMLQAQTVPVDPTLVEYEQQFRTRGAKPGDYSQQMINLAEQARRKQQEINALQELGQRQLEQQVQQYQQQPQEADLTGLLTLAEAWGPSQAQFAKYYRRPESQTQRDEKVLALQEKLQQRRLDLSKGQAEQLRAQLEAYKSARGKPLEEELTRAKIRAYDAAAGKEPEVKADQALSAGFGKRMLQAEDVFNKLEKEGYSRGARLESVQSMLPGELQSSKLRQQTQAEKNFVNAILRRESGAAISTGEYQQAEQQYFPRPGDTPEVLEQKRANRLQGIESMKVSAGRAWDKVGLIKPKAPPKSKEAQDKLERLKDLERRALEP